MAVGQPHFLEGQMKFRIHFVNNDGTEDHFDIKGETLEDIREIAGRELFARTKDIGTAAWSEEIKEQP